MPSCTTFSVAPEPVRSLALVELATIFKSAEGEHFGRKKNLVAGEGKWLVRAISQMGNVRGSAGVAPKNRTANSCSFPANQTVKLISKPLPCGRHCQYNSKNNRGV